MILPSALATHVNFVKVRCECEACKAAFIPRLPRLSSTETAELLFLRSQDNNVQYVVRTPLHGGTAIAILFHWRSGQDGTITTPTGYARAGICRLGTR